MLIVHHLAVDGVSWRILLEDINIAWAQHRAGQSVELVATGTSFQRWAACSPSTPSTPTSSRRPDPGGRSAAAPAALPAAQPETDTYATAGRLSLTLDAETTRTLLGEVPAAFHAGVQDILLIGFALAVAEFLAARRPRLASTSRATAGTRNSAADVDLSRTVGWFTTKYPVALAVGELPWAQVVAGEAALGAVVKKVKEQLRALPHPLTYGLLRYLNADIDLAGSDPTYRIQLPWPPGQHGGPGRRWSMAARPGGPVVDRYGRRRTHAAAAHR